MNDKDLIIYYPFDEYHGSEKAFDYSSNRADGIVTNAEFVSGKVGNAIDFDGNGKMTVGGDTITPEILNNDWTLMAWVDGTRIAAGSPSMFIWIISFEGLDNYIEREIPVKPGRWVHLTVTKEGYVYKFYVDAVLVDTIENNGEVTGMSLSQDVYSTPYGMARVDELKMYDCVLRSEDIVKNVSNVKVLEYLIDGVNLKDYGVHVSDSNGLLDRPKMKKPYSESWSDYNGSMVDLNHKYVEDRIITLECWIEAKHGKAEFVSAVNRFSQIFDKTGTHRLMVDIHPTKPLVYEVYLDDSIEISKRWNDALMVGTFKLKLREANPVKRVLKYIKVDDQAEPLSIKIKTDKMVDIYWGDGLSNLDVAGDITLTHEYENPGNYYVIIAGCIDEIKSFDTNTIIVWPKI